MAPGQPRALGRPAASAPAVLRRAHAARGPGATPRSSAEDEDDLGVGSSGGRTGRTERGPGIYGLDWWSSAEAGTTAALTWPDAPADTFHTHGHWDREVVTVMPGLGLVVAARGDWGSFAPGDPAAGMNETLRMLAEAVVAP